MTSALLLAPCCWADPQTACRSCIFLHTTLGGSPNSISVYLFYAPISVPVPGPGYLVHEFGSCFTFHGFRNPVSSSSLFTVQRRALGCCTLQQRCRADPLCSLVVNLFREHPS